VTQFLAVLCAALGATTLCGAQLEGIRSPTLDAIQVDFSRAMTEYDAVLQVAPDQLAGLSAELTSGDLPTNESGVLRMPAVMVEGSKLPVFEERLENRVQELLRTGTLAERVGRRITSKLWMKGDKGVMFSISW
jgi:hypothetical protein